MPAPLILVIDDDKLFRWSVSRILQGAGYRIREAATAEDGLAAVQECQPDLVILDIGLPDQDGFTVLKSIQQARPDLRMLMVTADPTPDRARQALRHGAWAHLTKPCDWSVLLAVVSEALQPPASPRHLSD